MVILYGLQKILIWFQQDILPMMDGFKLMFQFLMTKRTIILNVKEFVHG